MKIGFIGGGRRLNAAYRIFEGKSGFEISGMYSKVIDKCADTAIYANSKIYLSPDKLCDESDVIVLAVSDKAVPEIISALTRLHTHGKVFVTISETLTCSDLSMAYPNACAIINGCTPLTNMSDADIGSGAFVCNLFGKNHTEFYQTMTNSEINCSFISPKQLQLYRTSLHMVKYTIEAAVMTTVDLLKIAAIPAPADKLVPVVRDAIKYAFSSAKDDMTNTYIGGNLEEIRKHAGILKENGIESAIEMYKSTAKIMTEKTCNDFEAADEVFRLLHNL